MNEDNKKKNIITIIVVIAVLMIGVGGYFTYNEFFSGSKTNDEDSSDKVKADPNSFFKIEDDCDMEKEKICSKELVMSGKKVNIVVEQITNEEMSITRVASMKVDDKSFDINETSSLISIKAFKDLLIVETTGVHFNYHASYDIIDLDMNVVFTSNSNDFGYDGMSMTVIGDNDLMDPWYSINGDKLIFAATRGAAGFAVDQNCYFYFKNYTGINKENYEEIKDEIFTATFEVEYLGNGQFAEPKLVSSTKVKDIDKANLDYCFSLDVGVY